MRRIVQITPCLVYGDGVSNDVLAIHRYFCHLREFQSLIYCENLDQQINEKNIYYGKSTIKTRKEDIILLHLSTESIYNKMLHEMKGYKIIVYHNITPPHYFSNYNQNSKFLCEKGIREVVALAGEADYCLADSEFNKQELLRYGYKCPIEVFPIIISFEDYKQDCDRNYLAEYQDGKTNILFTGRIAPNKKYEDIILAFFYYQKYFNENSRLILVGNPEGMEKYYDKLKSYIAILKVKNVVFTEHISFSKMLSCYKAADLFLCMSEHEGFCIPLVEAMIFGVPIIAYDSCAVPDTMGQGGLLVRKKDPIETAALMSYVLTHESLVTYIKERQQEQLRKYEYKLLTEKLLNVISNTNDISDKKGESIE